MTHTPSLTCTRKNDSFTWQNVRGNQKLLYPVGLLTSDEIMLSGGTSTTYNVTYYLSSGGTKFWTMSPYGYFNNTSNVFYSFKGQPFRNAASGSSGLRPSISLKNGTIIVDNDADGTVTNPYIIAN